MSAFLEWYYAEDQVSKLVTFARTHFSATAHVVEQHGQSLRLSLPFESETAKTSLAKVCWTSRGFRPQHPPNNIEHLVEH